MPGGSPGRGLGENYIQEVKMESNADSLSAVEMHGGHIRFEFPKRMPCWWWRLWYWVLLGWTWTDLTKLVLVADGNVGIGV